ncbi:nickel-responsive transcriptional regulator NikR [Acidocella aminolytica]|jgi:CopG family nickel-responsive transcriptional regulator|uniref:Putative nickel-responsive regulator n=1 Tax=Acidocella aminolytica 101 = DSM 11237 TaxID=1120923 RepID=A0A0D6PHM0_9PROT|nr:nickel-responsive transcriptional regulator NikR [Acidocella aminolytica]GAN80698.1 transcriptional regulator Ni-responsive NikR [Acidocella aminolytica 101 = DSM 11237]GBQ37518.1 putative transcriptional regulator [Acidocella aminolytica 101 = DSM 11237]SHE53729.1 CopG family transcriptional regulator, nickel-responsive regulator [Acidocella aminolytica 101 = DSM 11237]
MERITITIDDELLASIDALASLRGYTSRSEAIRDMLREAAKREHLANGSTECVASLTYVYDHSMRDLPQRLVEAQHSHHDLGIATTHVHFDHDNCLEVALLRGSAEAIQHHADSLTAQRGVRHARLHLIPLPHGTAPHRHGGRTHSHGGL